MGEKFGEFLKRLREDRKMTLREVEQKATISNAYLSQVERGERNIPTLKILNKLAKAYGVPISLLTEKAEKELKLTLAHEKSHSTIPAPDTEFICRGYENLSEEKKEELKKYLGYLTSQEKEKKK